MRLRVATTRIGVALGFIANIIASQRWELIARYRAWQAARKLVGMRVAYKMHGRMIDTTPMRGAGLTVVSAKGHWLSADSAVLDVRSQDVTNGDTRNHDGHIVSPRGVRGGAPTGHLESLVASGSGRRRFRAPAARAALEYVPVVKDAVEHGGDCGHVAQQFPPVFHGPV